MVDTKELAKRFLSKFAGEKAPAAAATPDGQPDLRRSKRVDLPIPIKLKVGDGEPSPRRLRNASLLGILIEGTPVGRPGEIATLQFAGYPDVCDPFVLTGRVARLDETFSPGLAVEISREDTPAEALAQYRKLVLHYLRHRPLLEKVDKRLVEGKCKACGWIGKVSERNPVCYMCAEKVVPVAKR